MSASENVNEMIEAFGGIERVRRHVLSIFYDDFARGWSLFGQEGISIVAQFDPDLLAEARDMLTPEITERVH